MCNHNNIINEHINNNDNNNIDLINDNKKDNLSEHNLNPVSNIFYSKKTFKGEAYNPNKTYSRKIAK